MKYCLLLLLITYSVIGQSKIPFGQNSKLGKYASIRGFNMYYETYGKGEPLLIIHGNGG
ncbi:MAG: hypothetical protein RLZ91_1301, partial [Bacteroidota bacterium]